MDPHRRRRIRLYIALSVAVVLSGALVYSSFTASTEARTPSQLLKTGGGGHSYELTGKVAPGYTRDGDVLTFRVSDRSGSAAVPVRYTGAVPDPFKAGREVIVTVRRQGNVFIGQRDSLITKCPSKFKAAGKA
jgi:cytochrome c-type biogenesis protein CcmE